MLCRHFYPFPILLHSNAFNGPLIFYFVNATQNNYAGGIKGTNIKIQWLNVAELRRVCAKVAKYRSVCSLSVPSHSNARFSELCPECPCIFQREALVPSECLRARDAKNTPSAMLLECFLFGSRVSLKTSRGKPRFSISDYSRLLS